MNSEAGDTGVVGEQLLDHVPFLFEKAGVLSLLLTGHVFHRLIDMLPYMQEVL